MIIIIIKSFPEFIPSPLKPLLSLVKSATHSFPLDLLDYCGSHPCNVKPPQHSGTKEDIKEYIRKNPKPSQVQSAYFSPWLETVRTGTRWKKRQKSS